ncbi:MAG: tetratricopeptide repeat protein [Sedimentisphaerales bacterium]|nr:tetratricopeptide repeat protein [Sedimentisphaerales bacterium]
MSADPARATRWEITLSEVLDVAAERLKAKFSSEPLVEASIRYTLGNTYLSLGKHSAAEPHIEGAYRIRRVQLGPKHPDTLASTSRLAMLRVRQGNYAEAERFGVTAAQGMQEVLGKEHQDTLASMYHLGVVYWYQRRNAEAETLFSEVLELRRRTLGENHPDTLRTLNGLGWTYTRQGRYAQAERLFERVFQRCLETLGQEHDLTQEMMNGLITVYTTDANRYEEAETLGRRCLALRRQALGDKHPETLEAMGLLAGVHAKQGRLGEAERLYQAVQKTQLRLGIQDDKVLRQLVGLAGLYVEQARYADAEPLLLQEFQRRAEQFGPDHSHTVETRNRLVSLYESWNKPEEAARWRAKPGGEALGGM